MTIGVMSNKEKDYRIAELIYESACSQLQANKYALQISELEKEIAQLKAELRDKQ